MAAYEDTVDWTAKGAVTTPAADYDLDPVEWDAKGEYISVGGWGGAYDTWLYRRPITINNTSGGVLTDYQVLVELTAANHTYAHSEADGADIRFTRDDGTTALDYWIEEWVEDGTSKIWVEIDSIPTGENICAYVYYGKPGASDESDGDTTFDFFDDFPNASLDTNKWDSIGTIEIGSSEVTVNENDIILGKTAFGFGYGAYAKVKVDNQDCVFLTMRETIANANNRVAMYNTDGAPDPFDSLKATLTKAGSVYTQQQTEWTDFRNTYLIYQIKRISGSKVIFNQAAHEYQYTDSDHIPTVDLKVGFWLWSPLASTLTCDWVFIHKCASAEPTYAVGGEAAAPEAGFVSVWATQATLEWAVKGAFAAPNVLLGALIEWDVKGGVTVTAQGVYTSTLEWTGTGAYVTTDPSPPVDVFKFVDLR